MNKYVFYVIIAILLVIAGVSTTLYIFNPRVIENETIRIIEKKIPDRIDVSFAPAKPDTVYPAQIKGQKLLASKKTFKEALGGTSKKPYALLTLDVYGYASVACDYLSGDVGIEFYKENIIDDLKDELPKIHKWNWNSFLWGSGIGLFLSMLTFLLIG